MTEARRPSSDEPGYWNWKLGNAKTEAEFIQAYVKHSKELEKHGSKLRPFDVLVTRLLGRFGQYKWGEADDERREDAIWTLTEIQRYLALVGINHVDGISLASAVKKRTYAEFEADVACAATTLQGYERSSNVRRTIFDADGASPDARKHAASVDLNCDGDCSGLCPSCQDMRLKIAKAIDAALHEEEIVKRAAAICTVFTSGASMDEIEKRAEEQGRKQEEARKDLKRRRQDRRKVFHLPDESEDDEEDERKEDGDGK